MKQKSDLKLRTLVGLFLFILMLVCIFVNQLGFMIFFGVALILCLKEYFDLVQLNNKRVSRWFCYLAGLVLFICNGMVTFYKFSSDFLLIPVLLSYLILPLELYRRKGNFDNIAHSIFSIFYIALPVTLLINIVCPSQTVRYEPWLFLAFILLIIISDTGAYLVGTTFGKRKLFEKISPKKSWEGAIGGLLFSICFSFIFYKFIGIFSMWEWVGLSVVTVVSGIYGDLVESFLKRKVNVKDSGTLLPGHGGILDRMDGFFLATPCAFAYFKLFL